MLLLGIYIATFVLGGILLGASLFLGHHDGDAGADADADADVHADADADGDADTDADGPHEAGEVAHAELSDFWIPFISVRFWIFFLCFFGLTGVVLTLLALAGRWGTLAAAVGVGFVSGFAAAFVIQKLKKAEVGSTVGLEDYKGKEGLVLLPIGPGDKGKIRMVIKDQTVDMVARTEEALSIERGRRVLVIEVVNNEAVVVPAPELESSSGNGE